MQPNDVRMLKELRSIRSYRMQPNDVRTLKRMLKEAVPDELGEEPAHNINYLSFFFLDQLALLPTSGLRG